MANIFEITTINRDKKSFDYTQDYSVIEVNSSKPFSIKNLEIRTLEKGKYHLEEYALKAYHAYRNTGLDEVIKEYPPKLVKTNSEPRLKIAEPETMRIVYDMNPLSMSIPILRLCPTEGKQVWVAEYNINNSKLHINHVTFSNEFEGSMDMWFEGLQVFLHMRNFEKENENYYGRDLKKNI